MRIRKPQHPQLLLGYALIGAETVLGTSTVSSQIQHYQERRVVAAQASKLRNLGAANERATRRIGVLESQNLDQYTTLAEHRGEIQRQDAAIERLKHLRRADLKAITTLHNTLAAHHLADQRVQRELQQLEANNAAARSAIQATAEKGKP